MCVRVTATGLGEIRLSKATGFKVCRDPGTSTVLTLYSPHTPLPPQETCRALPEYSIEVRSQTEEYLSSLLKRQPEPSSPPAPATVEVG